MICNATPYLNSWSDIFHAPPLELLVGSISCSHRELVAMELENKWLLWWLCLLLLRGLVHIILWKGDLKSKDCVLFGDCYGTTSSSQSCHPWLKPALDLFKLMRRGKQEHLLLTSSFLVTTTSVNLVSLTTIPLVPILPTQLHLTTSTSAP